MIKIEVNGKELEARERDLLINRFLINAVCYALACACWAGWIAPYFVWGAAAISLASLLLRKNTVFSVVQRAALWLFFVSNVYENSLSPGQQNAVFVAVTLGIWSELLWDSFQKRRKPKADE